LLSNLKEENERLHELMKEYEEEIERLREENLILKMRQLELGTQDNSEEEDEDDS
jgi:hypothetical protein